jgi:hypothetical protein
MSAAVDRSAVLRCRSEVRALPVLQQFRCVADWPVPYLSSVFDMLEQYARTFVVHPDYIRHMEYELRNPGHVDGREVLGRPANEAFLNVFETFAEQLGLKSTVIRRSYIAWK